MSDLSITQLWFQRAVPQPNSRNFAVQVGCHFEEVAEMLDTLDTQNVDTLHLLDTAQAAVKALATHLKKQRPHLAVGDRKEFLDACADQVVTATGSGYMAGMSVPEALNRVNTSNFSKFDKNGQPIFDENGKIKKGPDYKEPDLEGLY